MVNFHHFRIILVIFSLNVDLLVCQKNGKVRKVRIPPRLPLPQGQTFIQPDNLEPNGVNTYSQQMTSLMQSLPRLDNRNSIAESPIFRSRPTCSKRIRISNGITRFRERGAFVRFSCSDSFTLLGTTIAVCLRGEWSEMPPICVRPGCRRLLIPTNGQARLTYSGAVADFVCKAEYKLEGSRIIYCDGNRWNDTEPSCIPIHPLTTSTEVWEWPQPPTTEKLETENGNMEGFGFSSTGHQESWDYNTVGPTNFISTENPNNLTSSQENMLSPIVPYSTHTPTATPNNLTDVPISYIASEKTTTSFPLLNQTASSTNQMDNEAITTTRSRELTYQSTTDNEALPPSTEVTRKVSAKISSTIASTTTAEKFIPEVVKTTNRKTEPTSTTSAATPPPKVEQTNIQTITTTENWEPFPDNAFSKFDQELEAGGGSISYETRGASVPTIPEFIVPISPHKLDDDGGHAFYKKWGHVSIMGGIVLGALLGITIVGGMATYFWRKKVGIARAGEHDQDGRTLSASDANDDFMWMDASRDHRMSRL